MGMHMSVLERAYKITFAKDNASTEWSNGAHSVSSPISGWC